MQYRKSRREIKIPEILIFQEKGIRTEKVTYIN